MPTEKIRKTLSYGIIFRNFCDFGLPTLITKEYLIGFFPH